ncbi:alpha/beta fold hydrolase [Micromonospora chersina]|uniref:alpha/beta hydrolase family protein n=1 Tax=Micromonospora chersina TaxID=47854 RepID=UPI00379819F7
MPMVGLGSPVTLVAADGRAISGRLFRASGGASKAVLIAGATGVAQRFYRGLATWLAAQGATVITIDYRGIGESRSAGSPRQEGALMSDWGRYDIEAALRFLKAEVPDQQIVVIGHSAGGWLLSLAPSGREVAALVTVASQNGYWGYWRGKLRLARLVQWYVLLPLASAIMGRLPSLLLGGGEPLPGAIARQWARWGRSRNFLAADHHDGPLPVPERFAGQLLAICVPGDTAAPRRAVDWLPTLYPNASAKVVQLHDRYRVLGHFGAFRPGAAQLWAHGWHWVCEVTRSFPCNQAPGEPNGR